MNRDFKGIWIPANLWLSKELSITEKCLLAEIDSLDNNPEKGCFASNEYLGTFLGISTGRTANLISELKKKGYIEQVYFDGRNRGLRVPSVYERESRLHENVNHLHKNVKADFTETLKQTSRKSEHIIKTKNKEDNKEEKVSFSNEKEATKEKTPNLVYRLYETYATFFESRAAAQAFPRTGAGHLVLDAKDARALKEFVKYFGEVHPGSAEEAWGDFLEAAWQAGDKWIRDNFCPHILWGQKNRLFTRAAKATAPRIQATDEEAEAVLRAMEELGR